MNANTLLFVEYALTRNVVFVLFFGALFPLASGLTVKKSLTAGLKLSLVLVFAGLLASATFALLPEGAPFLYPAVVLLLSVAAVRVLGRWGELEREWAGLPGAVFFLAPVAGIQTLLWTESIAGLDAVLVVFGSATGFYLGLVLIVAFIEQIRTAEAPPYARRIGTLFFSLAIIALGLAGLQFL